MSTQSVSNWTDHIKGPTLLLDEGKVKRNIADMKARIAGRGASFRPHFKTHQSQSVGRWFRDAGITKITTSSLPMAEYFAEDGWNDILIAIPANPRNKTRYFALAQKIELHLLFDHPATVSAFSEADGPEIQAWIEIDIADNRSGIPAENHAEILSLARTIEATPNLRFRGIVSHAGYTYRSRSATEIAEMAKTSGDRAQNAFAALKNAGYPEIELSYGDTPSCSTDTETTGYDELRPGNFVFYDLQQVEITSSGYDQIGVAMAVPVISLRPEQGKVIVHGGGVHLSRDFLGERANASYGQVVEITANGWGKPLENVYVKSLSQEHGVISGPESWVETLKPGSILGILPVHSCMAVDCMPYYLTTRGERMNIGKFVE